MELNDFLEYEIGGCKGYWAGSRETLNAHLEDLKHKRSESPRVIDLNKIGRQLKNSQALNTRAHALKMRKI